MIVNCPDCKSSVSKMAEHCPSCGRPLAPKTGLRCDKCGAVNPESGQNCWSCGKSLAYVEYLAYRTKRMSLSQITLLSGLTGGLYIGMFNIWLYHNLNTSIELLFCGVSIDPVFMLFVYVGIGVLVPCFYITVPAYMSEDEFTRKSQ